MPASKRLTASRACASTSAVLPWISPTSGFDWAITTVKVAGVAVTFWWVLDTAGTGLVAGSWACWIQPVAWGIVCHSLQLGKTGSAGSGPPMNLFRLIALALLVWIGWHFWRNYQ